MVPNGGFFEGRFYWPFRYYLGGRNFLSGYPYFTTSGSKLLYGRLSYRFPLSRRLNSSFLNFSFTKAYAELFAETGAVGNFGDLNDIEYKTKSFLSDIGAEVTPGVMERFRVDVAREANKKVYVIMALLAAAKEPELDVRMQEFLP